MSIVGYESDQVKGLHPPKNVVHVRHLHNYVYIGQGLKADRKIFHNVVYTEFEEQGIEKMLDHFSKNGIQLPEEYFLLYSVGKRASLSSSSTIATSS